MESADLKGIVGNLAVIFTMMQFLSGALVCKQYMVDDTTGESSPLPFISCILSCALWLFYGFAKEDERIEVVNIVGIILMTTYTTIFYIYTRKKSVVIKQCLMTAIIFFIVLIYLIKEDEKATLLNILGMLASVFTVVTISAPMSKLLYVIKVKSTDCLPFPLILMSFIVSSLWTLYGRLVDDAFLEIVNILGAGIALAQLSLFIVYPSAPKLPILPKNV